MKKPDCRKDTACFGHYGDITVVADVLEDGTVGKAEASGDQVLVEAAAAKTARFTPGRFKGKPTSTNFDIKFHF